MFRVPISFDGPHAKRNFKCFLACRESLLVTHPFLAPHFEHGHFTLAQAIESRKTLLSSIIVDL